jgi:hypothetical protein
MEAEIRRFAPLKDGWIVTVRFEKWIKSFTVPHKGTVTMVGNHNLPPYAFSAMLNRVLEWRAVRERDIARSAPYSPGDSHE